jgi:hypothetical protein
LYYCARPEKLKSFTLRHLVSCSTLPVLNKGNYNSVVYWLLLGLYQI